MTAAEVSEIITGLCAAYGHELTDAAAQVWLDELEPLDFSAAETAAKTLRREHKKFPTVADFFAVYRAARPPDPFPTREALEQRVDSRLPPEELHARIDAMKAKLPASSMQRGQRVAVRTPNETDETDDTEQRETA